MNYIDLLIIIPLIWAIYTGFTKGLVIQVAALVGIIAGIWGALRFSDFTGNFLYEKFGWDAAKSSLVSFALTFLVVLILVHLLARLIDRFLKLVALGFFNRLMGVVFSLAKMLFIISIFLYLINIVNNKYEFVPYKDTVDSVFYNTVASFAPSVMPFLKSFLKAFTGP